jgi:ribosome biogenesis GTPase / thiamine phosphate phosphatase
MERAMDEYALLGWNPHFQSQLNALEPPRPLPARVAVEHRSQYILLAPDGEIVATLAGRLLNEGVRPAVGDWVGVRGHRAGGVATISKVFERKGALSRQRAGRTSVEQVITANVDVVFVVTSANFDFNPRRLERFITTAWDGGSKPVIVINKVDLCEDPTSYLDALEGVALGIPVALVSAIEGRGVEGRGMGAITEHIGPGITAAFVGSSGVGKSTLINHLLGRDAQRTYAIREADAKGRHTTTRRELRLLPSGGLLVDTPGIRELELTVGDESAGLEASFEDLEARAATCQFRDCVHESEPGCAVTAAIAAGDLDPVRLHSYRKLRRELAHAASRKDAASRREQRLRGKRMASMIKEAKKRKRR